MRVRHPTTPVARPTLVLSACGTGLIALTILGLALPQPIPGQFGIGHGERQHLFIAVLCMQDLIYAGAVAVLLRGGVPARAVWSILACAIALRALVVVSPPFLSNDLYRYIWDGKVQAAGINPYRYIPDDQHLAFLRDTAVFPNINRADYAHTIYPPAAEMVFFLASRIGVLLSIPPVLNMKLAMLLLEGVGIWAMIKLLDHAGLPRTRILIYAWNPLPVWEFAGNGHVDAIAVCFIALALLATVTGRRTLAAAGLAAATLTKFLPIVLVPALWRRWDWRFAAVFTGLILALYAPYLGVGTGVFGFLGGYTAQEGIIDGHGIFLLSAFERLVPLPPEAAGIYLAGLALVLGAIGAAMVFGPALPSARTAATRAIAQRAMLLGGVLMLGVSPHYAWYYCWLLIPACIVPWPSILYLASTASLLYLDESHMGLFWPSFVYGPFIALAARDMWNARARIGEGIQRVRGGSRI